MDFKQHRQECFFNLELFRSFQKCSYFYLKVECSLKFLKINHWKFVPFFNHYLLHGYWLIISIHAQLLESENRNGVSSSSFVYFYLQYSWNFEYSYFSYTTKPQRWFIRLNRVLLFPIYFLLSCVSIKRIEFQIWVIL